MNIPHLSQSALDECLQTLNHLFIDITRLTYEQGYEEILGGYCELKVATLDFGIPAAKLVAAKRLRLGMRPTEPKRLAFRLARELKVWAGLRHPHVLPLLGFYLDNTYKTALLISEYMSHGDLKDYISKRKPSSNERLRLVRDLTDGLTYLHSQHVPIRHGDLKPGNVLVNPDRRALLADFGLSRALDTGPTGFTTGNDARGTVRYSSPEILLHGTAAASLPNDMWSWGCLVFEALTDKIPFADIQLEPQLIIALVQGKSPNNTIDQLTYPRQFRDLLANCWSREPNQRPTAIGCLRVVESTLLSLKPGGNSGTTKQARLPGPPSVPLLTSLAPFPSMADPAPSMPKIFTSRSTQRHNLNHSQQEPRTLPAENSPRNSSLSNQRSANRTGQTQQLSQNFQGLHFHLPAAIADAGARPEPVDSNSTLINRSSPELSPAERSVLARQESMQRLEELKRAHEARNAVAVGELSSTSLKHWGTHSHTGPAAAATAAAGYAAGYSQAVPSGGQAVVEIDPRMGLPSSMLAVQRMEAAASALTFASPPRSVAPQPAAEWAYPTRQEATIQELSSEAGPSNFAPAAIATHSLAVNSMDDSERLEFSGGSRLRTRKGAFTPAWVVPPRVLLVEDDHVSRKIFSKFMQVSGCVIDLAVDGAGAVNEFNLGKYDIVFMDIVMPRLDGVAATRLIRQFDQMTPIIAITSKSTPNDIVTYYSNGMNDILPKPFTRESLLTMLEKYLTHLKTVTMARPFATAPSKVLPHRGLSMAEWVSMEDSMDPFPSLDPPPVTVMSMSNPARSGKRTLEGVDDDRKGKRPRFEVVE